MPRKPTIALTVSTFGQADPAPVEMLSGAGVEVLENPHGRKLKAEEVVEVAREAHGLIAGTEPLDASVLEQLENLRVISRVGVSMENVDLNAAVRLGITVHNTPDAVTDPVAELVLGGILNVMRHVSWMDRDMRAGEWTRRMGTMLRGKTVGILGLGRIGRRLATLMNPFYVRLVATDRAPDSAAAGALNVEWLELDDLLRESDVLTLHLPGGEQPVIGARELELIKPGAILVNASRGGLVDEAALANALRSGHLGGAYVDTFDEEPYSGPLRELDNVLLTPHAGSYAAEARAKMETEAVANLLGTFQEWPL